MRSSRCTRTHRQITLCRVCGTVGDEERTRVSPKGPRIISGRLIIRGLGWLESLRGSVRPSLLPLMCRRGFLPSDRRLGWSGFSFTLPRSVCFCDRVWYDSRGQPSPPVMLTTLLCQFSRPPQREACSVCGVQGTFMGQSWEQVCLESSNGRSKITELSCLIL